MFHYLTRCSHPLPIQLSRSFRNRSNVYGGVNPLNPTDSHKILTEFSHITDSSERSWLEETYATTMSTPLPLAQKLNTLLLLEMVDSFDHFLHKRFSGYKRFSLEGLETIVPSLYSVCTEYYTPVPSSIVFSVAHRGKLSILASLLNYPLRNLFYKIKGHSLLPEELNDSGVYFLDDIHMGLTAERKELKGLALSFLNNSAHLELRGAAGMGKTRAKQDRGRNAMHLWVHGDGAMAGQGVNYELTQMAHLKHYHVGGTVHIVANNQLGYTATEEQCRSSYYCTEILKIIEAPIVHVNAMSVEDAVKLGCLAVKYRNKFANDFAIDIVGFRKYGHNELDDPNFTNPLMYKSIGEIKGVTSEYERKLVDEGSTTEEYIRRLKKRLEKHLEKEYLESEKETLEKNSRNGWIGFDFFNKQWEGMSLLHNKDKIETGYSKAKLEEICKITTQYPENFSPHNILVKTFQTRLENLSKNKVDWATAELLAIGSLLQQGYNVRLSGEDIIRGTFSQRNIGIFCQNTEKMVMPLSQIKPGRLTAGNSLLSELGVLGFEYGYSLDHPNNLVIWEAQFGDFANMAQPIIDTYIVSGEAKWGRQSGLVMLLPHGQEAQGPDHSSGMLERYLTQVNDPLATQLNIQVANCVYPANYFHLIRSLMLRNFRRPLILGTPKSGLRNKYAISELDEFTESHTFQPVILKNQGKGSRTLFLCNGKVYLDLLGQFPDISVLLIEELAPLPIDSIKKFINDEGKRVAWVQEEPRNSGVFRYIQPYIEGICGGFEVISRPGLSTNSTGNSDDFKSQQESIFAKVKALI